MCVIDCYSVYIKEASGVYFEVNKYVLPDHVVCTSEYDISENTYQFIRRYVLGSYHLVVYYIMMNIINLKLQIYLDICIGLLDG